MSRGLLIQVLWKTLFPGQEENQRKKERKNYIIYKKKKKHKNSLYFSLYICLLLIDFFFLFTMSMPVATSSAPNLITSGPVMANSCGTVTTGAQFGTYIPQRIFVGGIPRDTTEAELKSFFATYGTVKDAKIITDKGGASRGYAFITFEKQDEAERLISKDSEVIYFRNRRLNIGPAVKRHIPPQTTITADSRDTTPMYFGNSLSYAYQNGMTIVHPAGEENYGLGLAQHAQHSNYSSGTMVVPQPQAAYINPAAYSYPLATPWVSTGHWGLNSSGSTQFVSANPAYYYNYPTIQYAPEVVYTPSTAHPYNLESAPYMENFQVDPSANENLDAANPNGELGNEFLQPQNAPVQSKTTLITYSRYHPAMALSAGQHYQSMLIKQPKKNVAVPQTTILQKSYSDSVDNLGNMLLTPPPTPSTNTK